MTPQSEVKMSPNIHSKHVRVYIILESIDLFSLLFLIQDHVKMSNFT